MSCFEAHVKKTITVTEVVSETKLELQNRDQAEIIAYLFPVVLYDVIITL